jgi:hypothetical protein
MSVLEMDNLTQDCRGGWGNLEAEALELVEATALELLGMALLQVPCSFQLSLRA